MVTAPRSGVGPRRMLTSTQHPSGHGGQMDTVTTTPTAAEQLIRAACFRVAEFMASAEGERQRAARRAREAVQTALLGGVPLDVLSAALEASPQAVQRIVDADFDLPQLHPEAGSSR